MKIAAYGTLRVGWYNNQRFDLKYVSTERIKGYKLYDLGPYPAVIKEEDSFIEVDILETDDETKNRIDRMEAGAAYQKEDIDIDGMQCTIYYFTEETLEYYKAAKEIPSGNYNELQ
ncbi:MAG: hypothetical protein E6Q36_06845 [Chryseobacterium sp.]|nr:MAG: hypothetical protein E6Q36_06845 [Chryseobacterium sp.]